ncbi:MAG: LysE family translocator [Alphaproteobacteria bacterium]|nr:LysE family translocator [Alphaproteobacteria bacterium]
MFDPHLLWLYVGAAALLILTPGPDTFLVAATSAADGARAGVLASLGVFVGCLVHILLVAIGVSALIAATPWAFDAIKIAGAAYLVWIGLQALRAAWRGHDGEATDVAPRDRAGGAALFLRGALTNALNPKVAVFFIAFLPQFVDPARGHVAAQFIVLGLIFNVPGTLYLMAVAMVSGRATSALRRQPWMRRSLDALTGLFFIGLAAHLLRAQAKN